MIVGAVLARNEADRYLRRVLTNVASLCDAIVVLDDNSTDATPDIAKEFGATVLQTGSSGGWWGAAEAPARAQLWAATVAAAGPSGWVYVADADHELIGCTRADLRALARASHVNSWAWPLYDCWDSDTTHRVDGFWQAWRTPRPWMARAVPEPDWTPSWSRQGLHVGHFPSNYPFKVGVAPGAVKHLGYIKLSDRQIKARRYLDCVGDAT